MFPRTAPALRFSVSVLLALAFFPAYVFAQSPSVTDNDHWKQTCATLVSQSKLILNGDMTAQQARDAVKGNTAEKIEPLARDRDRAGQYFLACNFYYTAAIARLAAGENHTQAMKDDLILAGIEQKLGLGQSLGVLEKIIHAGERNKPATAPQVASAPAATAPAQTGATSVAQPAATSAAPAAAATNGLAAPTGGNIASCTPDLKNFKSFPQIRSCRDALAAQAFAARDAGDATHAIALYKQARTANDELGMQKNIDDMHFDQQQTDFFRSVNLPIAARTGQLIDSNGDLFNPELPGPSARAGGLPPGLYSCAGIVGAGIGAGAGAYGNPSLAQAHLNPALNAHLVGNGTFRINSNGTYSGLLDADGTPGAPARPYKYDPTNHSVYFTGNLKSDAGGFEIIAAAKYAPDVQWVDIAYQNYSGAIIDHTQCKLQGR